MKNKQKEIMESTAEVKELMEGMIKKMVDVVDDKKEEQIIRAIAKIYGEQVVEQLATISRTTCNMNKTKKEQAV